MAALKFASSHNMVAFLDKPTKSDGFEQIVDFLNAHPIKYALTVNLTIYTTYIKQLWTTAKVQTVNKEVQIKSLVDKKVIITETSIRRHLQIADENGTECLPNATIFAELERMGYENLTQKLTFYKAFFLPQWKFLIHIILQCLSAKATAWNKFSSTMASAIICLATNKKFNFSKYIFDNMVKNLEGGVNFLMYPRFVQVFLDKQVGGMSKHKKIYVTPSHTKKVFANMKRQGKDFSGRDTPLFPTMIVQAQEQEGEGSEMPTVPQHTPTINQPSSSQPPKKQKPRKSKKQSTEVSQPSDSTEPIVDEDPNDENVTTHSNDPLLSGEEKLKLRLKRLRKVGRTTRIESSEDEGLGDQEDASRQGRKIADIDADEEVTLIDETHGRNDDNLMFDTGVLDEQEVKVEKVVSTAEVTTTSATITTIDELTLAQTLIEIKAAKPKAVTTAVIRPKARGVVVQDPKELKAELEEEERLARQKEEDVNIAEWDNVQTMIDADYELAARLQAQENEELTIEERSKMFVELMDKRKKHFERLRAKEQRRNPPTKAQKRSQMSTYLKHMAGYKQNQLKSKNYDKIQKLFDKAMIRANMFVDMDTELVKESSKKAEMKQKLNENVEAEVDDEAEMKKHMEILPDDEVAIDVIPLATKPPIININREDLETLWKLVKAKYGNTMPEEAFEKVLWGDLKVMFEPDIESEVWRNLQGYKVTV
ncbi:hypothetical protein Tco_0398014 [Tanacetum coccineum]